jgi:hypothetical protein
MSDACNIRNNTKVCAAPKAETNLHRMEAFSIWRKPLKTRDFLDRSHFRQRHPRRTPPANSAAQPIDPQPETAPVRTSVAFLCQTVHIDPRL